jgi:endonuclease YncB( thermonuclease family)
MVYNMARAEWSRVSAAWSMGLHRFTIDLVFVLFTAAGAVAQDRIVGVASVIDGDTIEIHGQRIRLFGIDAPESSQLCVRLTGERWRCGQQASFALADRISRTAVTCQPRDLDRYGRVVAVCFKGSEDLNRWMVANGWAVAYKRYSVDYVASEAAARRNHINIWSGSFDMPWDWRAQHHYRRAR